MGKVRLELGAELDLLNKDELADVMGRSGSWEREAAFGLRQQDLPMMAGTTDGSTGNIELGANVAGGTLCGPNAGWYWAVHRISVDGLAASETVKIYKDSRFVCVIQQSAGSFVTFGKTGLILKGGEYVRLVGTGLTHSEQLTLYGEATSVPGPLMWKLLD